MFSTVFRVPYFVECRGSALTDSLDLVQHLDCSPQVHGLARAKRRGEPIRGEQLPRHIQHHLEVSRRREEDGERRAAGRGKGAAAQQKMAGRGVAVGGDEVQSGAAVLLCCCAAVLLCCCAAGACCVAPHCTSSYDVLRCACLLSVCFVALHSIRIQNDIYSSVHTGPSTNTAVFWN